MNAEAAMQISVLSHTYHSIAEDSAAEALFKHALDVHEGNKSDAIFVSMPLEMFGRADCRVPASQLYQPPLK